MTEILSGVHVVDGVDPSPESSTHVYLLKDRGATWTLIDTGLPGKDTAILAYLKAQKIEPTSVKKILITHLHKDHTGNLRRLAEVTKARTFAHWIEAAFIANRPKYDGPGMAPDDSVTVDETLKDGDPVDAAGGLIALHTPGHTPGHLAYYNPERKLLFSGDLFFGNEGKIVLTTPDFTLHTQTAQISARRMSQMAVDSVFTYHGGPFLTKAGPQLRALADSF